MRKRWKRVVSIFIAFMMLITSALPVSAASGASHSGTESGFHPGIEFYVSADGDDSNDGSLEKPFASLEAARDAIQLLKETEGLPDGGAAVNVRGGTYRRLGDSFTLTEKDSGTEVSPVVYRAYHDEEVNIYGNLVLPGEKFEHITDTDIQKRLSKEAADQIVVYDITQNEGITDFGEIVKNGFGWQAQAPGISVSVDGKDQRLSRYPNNGFIKTTKALDTGFVPRDHMPNPDGTCPECSKNEGNPCECKYPEEEWINQRGGIFTAEGTGLKEKYPLWAQESDIWVFGYFCWDWADDTMKISKLEESGNGMKMTTLQPSRYGVFGGKNFYAFNLLCEVDQPGEWYLDRENGKLYLYPEKDLTSSEVALSMARVPFISIENASYIKVENMNFGYTNGHGISVTDSDHVTIGGCDFSDIGQKAVTVGTEGTDYETINTGAHGGFNNTITGCNITRTGQGGIFLGGGDRYTLTPGNNRAVNNDISDFSVINRTYTPAVKIFGCGNEASNNKIHNAPHMAISYDGNDHIISNNDIYNVCYETSDCGAIYSVRTWSYRGVKITNNYLHDIYSNGGIGSAGVYCDDLSSGIEISANLFNNITGYVMLLGGGQDNVFTNNIILNSNNGKGLHYDNRGEGWAYYHAQKPNGNCYAELMNLRNDERFDRELWDNKYPELAAMDVETSDAEGNLLEARKPANAVVKDNILVGVANPYGNINKRVDELGTVERENALAEGTDIGFENAALSQFKVKENSLIKEVMGNKHFDVLNVGLYSDEYRTVEKTEIGTPVLTSPSDKSEDLTFIDGISLTWEKAEHAVKYLVEVSKDLSFNALIQSTATENNWADTASLESGVTYYWRVTAMGDGLESVSKTSETYCFTTSNEDPDVLEYGFEYGNNEFTGWTREKGVPVTSREKAHLGEQSFKVDQDMVVITKEFKKAKNGIVSVWLYDTMTTAPLTQVVANVTMDDKDPATSDFVAMGIETRAPGSINNYYYRIGTQNYRADVIRTEGWHELKWDYSTGKDCKLYIDDTLITTTDYRTGFNTVSLGDYWSGSGGNGTSNVYFDDVKIAFSNIEEIKPESISLDQTEIRMHVGETAELHASVMPEDLDVDFNWSAHEYEIARVESGSVTAYRIGTTTVTVYPEGYPNIKAECKIVVTADKEALSKSLEEAARITPEGYTKESYQVLQNAITAAIDILNDDVATQEAVDMKKTELENAVSGLVKVSVPESIVLDQSVVKVVFGKSVTVVAKVMPEDSSAELIWSSDDPKTAQAGDGIITGVAIGETTVCVYPDGYPEINGVCKVIVTADKAVLSQRLEKAKKIAPDGYTDESYQALQGAIARAIAVTQNDKATQEEVDAQTEELLSCIKNLVRDGVDKERLKEIVALAQEKVSDEDLAGAEKETAEHYLNTLLAAQMILANGSALQKETDRIGFELECAVIQVIHPVPGRDTLEILVNAGDIILAVIDQYPEETGKNFINAMEQAKNLLEDMEASDDTLQQAFEVLYESMDKLIVIDTERLIAALMRAEEIFADLDSYRDAGKAEFIDACSNAKDTAKDPQSQAAVNRTLTELDLRMEALTLKADCKALSEAVELADKIDLSIYTKDSINRMLDSLIYAKAVLNNENADQSEVNNAANALTSAINNLVKKEAPPAKADKRILLAKIAEAGTIKQGNYTDQSYGALKAAIGEAKKTADNPNVLQSTVDAQVEALIKAIVNLKVDSDRAASALIKAGTVTVKAENRGTSMIKLSWKKTPGADGYAIYLKKGKKWNRLDNVKRNRTYYNYNQGSLGREYTFAVKAYKKIAGKTVYSKWKSKTIKVVPQAVTVKGKALKGRVKISWKKVSGVTGYRIFRKSRGSFKRIAVVDNRTGSFSDKKAVKGKTYTYRVKTYSRVKGKNLYGRYSKEIVIKAK